MTRYRVSNGGARLDKVPVYISVNDHSFTVWCKSYASRLPLDLDVVNNTDVMVDYFDKDRVKIEPGHPLWQDTLDAYIKCQESYLKRWPTGRDAEWRREKLAKARMLLRGPWPAVNAARLSKDTDAIADAKVGLEAAGIDASVVC